MLGIVTSRTRHLYSRPPAPPYVLNMDCRQAQGLVAWWPLGELSAAAYHDYVRRRSYRLTHNGTMTLTHGPFNQGFAPSNTGVNANYLITTQQVVTAVPFSMACWFYAASTTTFMNLVVISDGTANFYYNFGLVNPTNGTFHAGDNDANAETTTTFTANNWFHAAGVLRTTTDRSAYLNGGGRGNSTSTGLTGTTSQLEIGGFIASFGPLNGRIAHVCIWNRALNDDEVALLYAPPTRWDLYYRIGMKRYSFPGAAAFPGGDEGALWYLPVEAA